MKVKIRLLTSAAFCGVLLAVFSSGINAQTLVNLGTQGRNIDFTGAQWTRPFKSGSSLPATCSNGDFFFNTTSVAGQNLFSCLSNSWSLVGQASSGLADPGANGIVKRTALNTTTAVPAPTGTIVGTTDAQTLTNKSIDASEINSGTISGTRLPALTGDITTAVGNTATTLGTVNSTPGLFGDTTHSVQVTVDAKGRVTAISQVPIAASSGTSYYQQLKANGSSVTQRSALNLSSAFTVTDNSAASRTDVDLATVNATTGTFGSSSQIPVLTVNAYGQVTAVSTVPAAAGNSGTASSTTAGTLSAMPVSCVVGALYFATDQPAGQQLYTCSSTNIWTQYISLGGSGALAFTNGALDIVTSVLPRLAAPNTFTGSNTFSSGVRLASSTTQPTCDTNARGLFWFQSNGAAKDSVQVCVYTGSAYTWTNLY